MSDVTLLPCPFCGSDAYIQTVTDETQCFAACLNCYCNVGEGYDGDAMPDHQFHDQETAAAAWNTRTAPALTPKQEAADEMFDALDSIAENLDPDSTDSDQYRNDDPEGAMDTCFSLAKAALAKAGRP